MNVTLTLIGQMGTFAVLIWFVMKFLWNPILQVMEDRTNRISEGLAAAERGRCLVAAFVQHGEQLIDALERPRAFPGPWISSRTIHSCTTAGRDVRPGSLRKRARNDRCRFVRRSDQTTGLSLSMPR